MNTKIIDEFISKASYQHLHHILAAIKRELKRRSISGKINKYQSNEPVEFYRRKDIEEYNSSNFLMIPRHKTRLVRGNIIYLKSLLRQDWSHIYNGGDSDEKYYVYAHVDPTKKPFISCDESGGNYGGLPFYIGKGVGDRAYDLNRNQGHGKVIRRLISEGVPKDAIPKIIIDGLSEAKAFELEAKLIYYFGTVYSKSNKSKGLLYNLDTPRTPEFTGTMYDYKKRKSIPKNNSSGSSSNT